MVICQLFTFKVYMQFEYFYLVRINYLVHSRLFSFSADIHTVCLNHVYSVTVDLYIAPFSTIKRLRGNDARDQDSRDRAARERDARVRDPPERKATYLRIV
jgi:hypothetical protein